MSIYKCRKCGELKPCWCQRRLVALACACLITSGCATITPQRVEKVAYVMLATGIVISATGGKSHSNAGPSSITAASTVPPPITPDRSTAQ